MSTDTRLLPERFAGLEPFVADWAEPTRAERHAMRLSKTYDELAAFYDFHCTQAVLPDMIGAGWGRIVNISSSSAQRGQPYMVHYVAAKAGLIGFTKALALEFGPHGVTVNTIPPSMIDTPMLRGSEQRGLPGGTVEDHARRSPVRRAGLPQDIANACAFLVSEEAGYITGQVMGVNGGMVT